MLLEISAEERWIGKIQFVGNLLYRHVGKTQSVLNGFHREDLYDGARPAIHRFLQDGREIFGRDVELVIVSFRMVERYLGVMLSWLANSSTLRIRPSLCSAMRINLSASRLRWMLSA